MPRPVKIRRICRMPRHTSFGPTGCHQHAEPILMTLDEYETIRLIDLEALSQEECAAQMNIARTTVQMIYASARRKLALSLTEGLPLTITGGEYRLCEGVNSCCRCSRCWQKTGEDPSE